MSEWIAWIISFLITLFEIGTSVLVFSSLFLAYYMDIILGVIFVVSRINEMVSKKKFQKISKFNEWSVK